MKYMLIILAVVGLAGCAGDYAVTYRDESYPSYYRYHRYYHQPYYGSPYYRNYYGGRHW